jgi:hypothetical protein
MPRRTTPSSSPGTPVAASSSDGAGRFACAYIFAMSLSRSYGTRPLSAWNSTQASA